MKEDFVNYFLDIKYLNCIIFVLTALFTNIFTSNAIKVIKSIFTNLFKALFWKNGNRQQFLYKIAKDSFFDYEEENSIQKNIWCQFYKVKITPSHSLRNIKFMPLHTYSPYLVINKNICRDLINFKHLKELKKYCSKLMAPEEILFTTLIVHLVKNLKNNSFSLAFNIDDKTLPLIPENMDIKDFLFMRRFQGSTNDYKKFKTIFSDKYKIIY